MEKVQIIVISVGNGEEDDRCFLLTEDFEVYLEVRDQEIMDNAKRLDIKKIDLILPFNNKKITAIHFKWLCDEHPALIDQENHYNNVREQLSKIYKDKHFPDIPDTEEMLEW